MNECIHTYHSQYGTRCLICERAEMMKASVLALNESLKDYPRFCSYPKCFVRYFEHFHIDTHTVTFTDPKLQEKNK